MNGERTLLWYMLMWLNLWLKSKTQSLPLKMFIIMLHLCFLGQERLAWIQNSSFLHIISGLCELCKSLSGLHWPYMSSGEINEWSHQRKQKNRINKTNADWLCGATSLKHPATQPTCCHTDSCRKRVETEGVAAAERKHIPVFGCVHYFKQPFWSSWRWTYRV